ncbi:MAG: DUF2330 domain-containing protein [Planctomycetota bacterium]|nr:DUF2330 domain-containing protein [Planctomycetota bacterium]
MLGSFKGSQHQTLCCLIFAASLLSNALADPCGMVPPISVPRDQPGIKREGLQQTYVFYKNGIETLVIHPGFKGTVDTFGMLIPFPSPPSLRKVSDSTFEHLKNIIDPPRVTVDLRPPHFNYGFGMGGSMLKKEMSDYGGGASADASMAIRREETRVLKEEAVGMYDVAVLQSGSSEALQKWMKQNGYRYPEGMDEVSEDYIKERWCFVAVRARVGHKQLVDPKPGQREVDDSLQPGASFDGHVQAMGFRFRVEAPVVPMRLSTYNEGDLRNIVYVLADKPMRFSNLSQELVMRQVSGKRLIANLKSPLPLLVIGGKYSQLPRVQCDLLRTQRRASTVMQAAENLFRGDLRGAINDRLSNREEELEKHLLTISERLQLRGEAIDKMHRDVTTDQVAAESDAILKEMESMTLTVIDGDFPRETLANENLKLIGYRLPARFNSPKLYDAKLHGPPPVDPPESKLYTRSLSELQTLERVNEIEFLCGVPNQTPNSSRFGSGVSAIPTLVWQGIVVGGGVIVLGFSSKLRKLFLAGIVILCLTLPAAAQTEEQNNFRYKKNNRPQQTLVLIDQLANGDEASGAADELIAAGKVSLRFLTNLVQQSESRVQRGWAIVCMAESEDPEADRYLRELMTQDLPELEKTWVQSARIQRVEELDELVGLFHEFGVDEALARPIQVKVSELVAADGKNDLEQILTLASGDARLQQAFAARIAAATPVQLAKVGLTAEDDAIRRLATGYLASLGMTDDTVATTVITQLKYDPTAEDFPFADGALFLPSLNWTQLEAKKLFLNLSLWMMKAEKEKNPHVRQQLANNLQSLVWRLPRIRLQETAELYVMQLAGDLSMKELLELAGQIGLSVPNEVRDYAEKGGQFEQVYHTAQEPSSDSQAGNQIHLRHAFRQDLKTAKRIPCD